MILYPHSRLMKILVTGANGQLGTHMRLQSEKSCHQYLFTDVAELDITDRKQVLDYTEANDISIIVNCAAYTNVDKAEDEESIAEKVNADAVRNLAIAMKNRGGWLFHVSTDYVFGGNQNNTPCTETESVNPTGAYGRTKLHGEQSIQEVGCHYLIFRTAWLYSEYGANFVKTMLRLQAEKPSLNVVFDQVGSPTYAGDLASSIYNIIENDLYVGNDGIYHYSNEGVCSWFDFSRMIAELSGNTQCRISPCHSSEFPSKVRRPSYSVLDKTKFKDTFNIDVPYWTESLKIVINNLVKK